MKYILFATASLSLIGASCRGCDEGPAFAASAKDIDKLPPGLESLHVRPLRNSDISQLARFQKLQFLDFAMGHARVDAKITDEGVEELVKLQLPKLQQLSLQWCENVTDDGLEHLANMKTLRSLDLKGCTNITDAGILNLARNPDLKFIRLRKCWKLTHEGIADLKIMLPTTEIEY
ncbi:MAG: hypothetical protein JWN70_6538 [Planctomycetaceae bacterium]|nr:hypothetical protein [Planctomycetaceae bacterium]